MSYTLKTNLANKNNYGSKRDTSDIKYIVIHYTGNDGDSDENNGKYFKNNIVKASAHYFVDSDSVTQSVPDNYIAYSVGGTKYNNDGGKYYGKCKNANSISIELCDDNKNGKVYPSDKTIANALELTKALMKKYGITQANVIRHYDVTGKSCPAYWCGTTDKDKLWKTAFYNKLATSSSTTTSTFKEYKVKVTATELNVRKEASASSAKVTTIKKGDVYTIVAEKTNGSTKWGKLKSGAGWISLAYVTKV
jgi:N-acetylmuramoyl-L-alanine amidase CwlA